MKKYIICLLLNLLVLSILKSQAPTPEFVKKCLDSMTKVYLDKHKEFAKIDFDIVNIISVTPKKAILVEQQKFRNKIEGYKAGWIQKENNTETQNLLKSYRSKDKNTLRNQIIKYREENSTIDQEINHKCGLIQRVLYEKSLDSTIVEYKKQTDDLTVLYYIAQVNSKQFYMSGKVELVKVSILFTLNSIYRKELSFEGHAFKE